MLNIALPKGRLGDQVYELLASVGYDCKSIYDENRKLVFENPQTGVRYLLVKPSDVAIYVEHHAADVGIVGKDILMESNPDDTFGTSKLREDQLVEMIRKHFDLRPAGIIKMLDLRRPIYKQTAAYGHFGRDDLDLPWEKLDKVDELKAYL